MRDTVNFFLNALKFVKKNLNPQFKFMILMRILSWSKNVVGFGLPSLICIHFNNLTDKIFIYFSYIPGADIIGGLGRTKRDLSSVDFMALHDKVNHFVFLRWTSLILVLKLFVVRFWL